LSNIIICIEILIECDIIIIYNYRNKRYVKLADLVSLLSGRDFGTRDYKSEIIDDTYDKMKHG